MLLEEAKKVEKNTSDEAQKLDITKQKKALEGCKTTEELKAVWIALAPAYRENVELLNTKETVKGFIIQEAKPLSSMKILDVDQRSDEWLAARRGKVTSTRLKDIVVLRGNKRKFGFYEILAEKIAYEAGDERPMDRGVALEEEAVEKLQVLLEKPIEQVGFCVSDDDPNMAISPDGIIKEKGKYTEAVEIKCLSTARHLQALIENKIPDEYNWQVLQYFIVMEDLQVLHFAFYDPRFPQKELFVIEVSRGDVAEDVEKYTEYQRNMLAEIEELAAQLVF